MSVAGAGRALDSPLGDESLVLDVTLVGAPRAEVEVFAVERHDG